MQRLSRIIPLFAIGLAATGLAAVRTPAPSHVSDTDEPLALVSGCSAMIRPATGGRMPPAPKVPISTARVQAPAKEPRAESREPRVGVR